MSVIVDCKGKEILRLSNSLFGLLHRTIIYIIEVRQLQVGEHLGLLLKKTDQDDYGPGSFSPDLDKFLKHKTERLLFASLVKEAIELRYDTFNQFDNCVEKLSIFHQELLKYAEGLKE